MSAKYFNPLLWFRWAGQFLIGWAQSIKWRRAPRAIPALILSAVLAFTAVIALNDGSSWRTDRLNSQWFQTLDVEDYDTAELVVMRQLHMRPDDTQLIYRLALVKDAKGETDDAIELLWRLVRLRNDEIAARWLLEKLFVDEEWRTLSDPQKSELGELLALLHKERPDEVRIQQFYADYLIATEKYAEAIPVLTNLVSVQPMRGLQAAALSRKIGREDAANRIAERTLGSVERMSNEDPTNEKLALAVAQNQLFLARYRDAVETLQNARRVAKTDQAKRQLSQAIGDAYVAWINTIEESESLPLETRLGILKMLQVALSTAPSNPRVLTLVADRVLAIIDDENEEIIAVREALIEGTSTGIAHFIRGTAALLNDDTESAANSLKLAAEHLPQSSAILNNLAVALSARDDSDLEYALKIADTAVKQSKSPTPYYYETRGQILIRLGRYFDAIPDLERALAIPSLAPKAHASLADCYEKIGESELSRLHREKWESATSEEEKSDSSIPDLEASGATGA